MRRMSRMNIKFVLSALVAFCAVFSLALVRAQTSGNDYANAYFRAVISKDRTSFGPVADNDLTTILHGRQAFPATSPALIITLGDWTSRYYNKYIDTAGLDPSPGNLGQVVSFASPDFVVTRHITRSKNVASGSSFETGIFTILSLKKELGVVSYIQEFMSNPDLIEAFQCRPPEVLSCVNPDSANGVAQPTPLVSAFQNAWGGRVVANQQTYVAWSFVNALSRNFASAQSFLDNSATLSLPYPVQTFNGDASGPEAIIDKFRIIYNQLNTSSTKERNIFPTLRAISGNQHLISATYSGIDRESGTPLDLPMVFLITTNGAGASAKITRIEVAFDIIHYTHAVTCQPGQVLGCTLRSPIGFYRDLLQGQSVVEEVSSNVRITSHGKQPWEFARTGVYNGLTGLQTWAGLYRENVQGVPTITAENVLTAVNGTAFELTVSATIKASPAFDARQVTMKFLHVMTFDNQGRIATIDEFSDSMDEMNARVCPNPSEVLGCVVGAPTALDAYVATPATPLSTYAAPPSTPASEAAWNFFDHLSATKIMNLGTLLRDDVVIRLPKTITGFGSTLMGRAAALRFFVDFGTSFLDVPGNGGFPPTVRSADSDTAIATSYIDGKISRTANQLKTPLVWVFEVEKETKLIREIEVWFDVTQWTYRYMCGSGHRLACTPLITQAPAFNPIPQSLPNSGSPSAIPLPVGGGPTSSAGVLSFSGALCALMIGVILAFIL